ncbi:MAG: diguanylate cyclase/phosphodiesterase (GGDEF & EAL domains) with PAS/PAC sensor(s) [uncultured Sulfurovum sp.]|uniref:Diguanylate cyclase/phosphodiesterase (GGDEF & EAL domains) with PAS/PAC sensor(S) n=1 Tax=uncultured Sulfurovum sp. TaxID=269237 RepID=A0A6S6T5I2_9BACT|nr:MAG: diguanylate cyclase/phosphodiesterase (GGDEF & EAL domains) with PAS/PAC sensor(s) [uncultured Sulfurovum sp.]
MKFKENLIDLIITDLSMPNVNGSDFIKMIRATNQEVPIIILSAYIDNVLLQESINYSVQGYLQKPVNKEILENKIEQIKEKKRQQNLIEEYHNITNASAIISKINRNGIITYVNETYCKVSGFQKEELIGQNHSLFNFQKESPNFFTSIWNQIAYKKEIWKGLLKHKTKSGELYYLQTTIQPIVNINGKVEEFISLSIPVTDIIHHSKQLSDYLKQHKQCILFLVKIEEFTYLKHSFTKQVTKKLQQIFAKELLKYMPSKCNFDNIYILNNGEFAFIKEDHSFLNKKKTSEILRAFQQKINHEEIKIGIVDYSLSIVCSLAYGENALDNARMGLSKILASKEEFIIATNFLEEATKLSNKKLNRFIMLKEAIATFNIVSYFQPIVENKTKKIMKYESLVRLIDNNNNVISPRHFLEIAKEGKYYHEISSTVLRNSFRALFNMDIEISINLSAIDIEDHRTRDEFFLLLTKYKTEAHRIIVEFVEDEKITNEEITKHFIQEIRKWGVKLAIDDFGTGESNFARIHAYQPDYIKIDGSLIRHIEQDSFSQDIVETIVFFAKKQNIKTIAEYVENENIYNIITNLGVDYSQGYYFSKAGLLKEFIPSSL